ncbi:MAG: elongation factor G [Endomicrobiales bacterium]|nr:elongation factor G [Endomicrobiales bacterium]
MKNYASTDLRNVCIVGSQGDGKTSLAEALLFNSKVTNRLGTIAEGNTVCDSSEEEIERKISINLAVSFVEHRDKKINLLVAPGYADFVGDIYAGLAVADVAVLVIGADTGVTPALENVWELLEDKKMPVAIFLNRMDKENVDFSALVKTMKERMSSQVVPINAPNAAGGGFSSLVNLFDEKVQGEAASLRDMMIETISSGDDTLTEQYLDGKPIAKETLESALKHELVERNLFPLLCGSATKNLGTKELADFIVDYFPAPKLSENKNFSALVYKSVSEPGMGQLNFVKIFSGAVTPGKDIFNFSKNSRERVGQLTFVQGKKKVECPQVSAGDLVALMKLKDTKTNDILCDEKTAPDLKQIEFPVMLYQRTVVTQSKGDNEKVGNALSIITLENPTIKHFFNPETKEMILAGMGALQLEIAAKKIKARYGVDVTLKAPRVPYKETIRGRAEVQGKYKRQTGGHGQYGDCWLKIEPQERGKGFEFIDKIVGGVIPKNFIPAVEKGVKETMEQGVVAGYQVVDVRVTVYDGSYHDVDSSDMAFKIAGALAFKKGFSEAKPVLLEPIMNVEVFVPTEYMGAIIGDLNSRRGRVLGMDKSGRKEVVKAQVPLGDMFQYAVDLRSLTKGSGKFNMSKSHYEDVPSEISVPLINAYQKSRTQEE